MSDRLIKLGAVAELFAASPYYRRFPISSLADTVFPAIDMGKFLHWSRAGELLGICTYGFFRTSEIEDLSYNGKEVYARNDGEQLHMSSFVCFGGRRNVFAFARYIQKQISAKYPNIPFVSAIRKKSGLSRPARYPILKGVVL